MSDDDLDMQEFLGVFFEECLENLAVMETGLLDLKPGTPQSEAVNTIFRAAHSIKGGCAQFGLPRISAYTHIIETLLDEMRSGNREVSRELVDLLLASVDCLGAALTAGRDNKEIPEQRLQDAEACLNAALNQSQTASEAAPTYVCEVQNAQHETCWHITFQPGEHIFRNGNDPLLIFHALAELGHLETTADVAKLPQFAQFDAQQCQLGWQIQLTGDVKKTQIQEQFAWLDDDSIVNIEPANVAPRQTLSESPEVSTQPLASAKVDGSSIRETEAAPTTKAKPTAMRKEGSSIRVKIEKLDELINLMGELVITQSMLSQFSEKFDASQMDQLRDGLVQLERNTRELQEGIMQVRMLPISFSFNRFPRLVRDLSASLGKKVNLQIKGEHTELDKTVLEKIADPLVHLVRNSLDHGIELPAQRIAAGKPEMGTITLNAYHEGGNIVIEVMDDGAGLPREKILQKARSMGLLKAEENLTDGQINDLVFQPGFSTSQEVSDVSGRGVGMDVVRRNINDLGGHVSITSMPGQGSTLTIRLPLTLAILDGQLIGVGDEVYVIPLSSIIETNLVEAKDIQSIAGQADLYHWRDEYLPIIVMKEDRGRCFDTADWNRTLLVVVEANGQRAALPVDELMAQQQVVIKSLESNFRQIDGVSGATILGDGRVVLILDIPGLLQRKFRDTSRLKKVLPSAA